MSQVPDLNFLWKRLENQGKSTESMICGNSPNGICSAQTQAESAGILAIFLANP